jgi:hypothetical protein
VPVSKHSNTLAALYHSFPRARVDNNEVLSFGHTYKPSCSNSTLRLHLERHHIDDWRALGAQNNWEFPKANNNVATPQDTRPPFSHKAFLECLVKFVISDDQVFTLNLLRRLLTTSLKSLNVIEGQEFRDLLLILRPDLKETDIPHRTKLRDAIIKT